LFTERGTNELRISFTRIGSIEIQLISARMFFSSAFVAPALAPRSMIARQFGLV